ncbi:NIPSNAP-domain-containing protein [Coniochaeta ligniaria NRRL 30616]|uniref:NIPSNAP-domain-containing protein n=1 Tax=Coniochaeta ligniaria NRRL 30616 TaxID=1408157 RepID=A0A1J7IVE9_9PEZI|nr:NIPSNAP-domain-containing protein [Coniochaeta ligniaria NRRL 30616]
MLTRQLLRIPKGVSAPGAAIRTFSTTQRASRRTPSLADIEPEKHDDFISRQKKFREQLAEAQKQREASALSNLTHVSSYFRSIFPDLGQGLGSLSTARGGKTGNAAAAKDNEPSRKAGPLTNLIYGTKEGREMDAQIEASFSQVLARGKYVHSIVFHEVKPECVDEYVELVGNWYPKMASEPENKVHLVGSWRTEVGDCDTFVHIWEYQRYQGYHASLHSIASHPGFAEFDKKLKKLIKSKKNSLMQEFSFWPTTPPRKLGGLFELRSYTLHPGNLLEWETHWRRGLKARREVMEGVGAWFVQIGDLNTVHHLWQFADLEERKIRREKSWSIEGWSETVHKTVPLIQEMKSRVLIPMPWSPVA